MSDNEESETEIAPTIKGPKLNKNGKPKKKYNATPEKLAKLAEARVKLAAMRAANPSNTAREKALKKQEKELRAKNLEIREEAVRKLQAKLTKNPTTVLTGSEDQIEEPVEDIEIPEPIIEVKAPKKDKKKKVIVESDSESSDSSDSEEEVTLTKKELKALLKKKEKKSKKVSKEIEKIPEEKIVVSRSNSFNGRPPIRATKPNVGLSTSANDLYNSLFAKPKFNL